VYEEIRGIISRYYEGRHEGASLLSALREKGGILLSRERKSYSERREKARREGSGEEGVASEHVEGK
jgi:hypothetical protein